MTQPDPTPTNPAPVHRPTRAAVAAAGAGVMVAGAALLGVGFAAGHGTVVDGRGAVAAPAAGSGRGTAAEVDYGSATPAQQVGVVDIDTLLGYSGGAAAGTGMVLTPDGEVLTNNHVVRGATSIRVTVVSTGATYAATVVGTDPSDDVAVLHLSGASGLQTANLGDSSGLRVGDTVTGVGNAGGVGGTPHAATGTVTALDRTITASDDEGSNAETLDGLIETDAAIQAGDSGGPLYDAQGEVVGMDTAASTSTTGFGPNPAAAAADSYAITVDDALAIAERIEKGESSATVHQGTPAFLGISVAGGVDTGGVLVGGVLEGGAAAAAGVGAGDVITAVGGTRIGDGQDLQAALAAHHPGDRVTLTWTDTSGQTHRATVTLGAGPAD